MSTRKKSIMKGNEKHSRGILSLVWQSAIKDYDGILTTSAVPRSLGWFLICSLSIVVALLVNLSVSMRIPIFTFPLWCLVTFIVLSKAIKVFYLDCCLGAPSKDQPQFSWRFVSILFIMYVMLLCINGYSASTDVEGQWAQAQQGKFTDWHPFFHSMFFWMIQQVWDSKVFACIIQIMLFVLVVGWIEVTLRRYAILRWIRILIIILVAFSPVMLSIGMRTLTKDSLFAIAVVSLMAALFQIAWSEGRWLESWWHKFLFSFLILCVSYLRHNGIFITIPILLLFFFMVFTTNRVKVGHYIVTWLLSVALFLGYFCGRNLLIEKGVIGNNAGQKYVEAIGVPIAIIGEVMISNPDSLDQETRRFCERLCPLRDWKMYFRGDGNSIKPYLDFDYLQREVPPCEFARHLWHIVKASPKDAYKAAKHITSIAWDPFPLAKFWRTPSKGNILRTSDCFAVCDLVLHPPVGWMFGAPGFALLLLMISGVVSWLKFGVGRAMPHLALIAYLLGTGLLMYDSGISDFRFYWAIELAYPIVILGSCQKNENTDCGNA